MFLLPFPLQSLCLETSFLTQATVKTLATLEDILHNFTGYASAFDVFVSVVTSGILKSIAKEVSNVPLSFHALHACYSRVSITRALSAQRLCKTCLNY